MTAWSYDGLRYRRRPTRTVYVGDVAIGSDHPIRVQSMTTPSTQDTRATADQAERLVEAGCEIVRVTVPTGKDADNLPNIRAELARRGVRVPLVADIHFTPAAAMKAVEHVEKVRINPGNFADKKKFAVREYTDDQYEEELERIERVFTPLVLRARELGVAMRIGTNHGSLSDRIMNRYGDTPEGMVESALEFVRICRKHDYHDLVLSMKSSNPVVVQQVYRLLAVRMAEQDMDYPFHLGVTEAGDGEDGRIKSSLGIGALLDEGIGDTIRVSLTEDPVAEIPVARELAARYNRLHRGEQQTGPQIDAGVEERRDPFSYTRRASSEVPVGPHSVGGSQPVKVEVSLGALDPGADDADRAIRALLDAQCGVRVPEETRAEIVSVRPVVDGPGGIDDAAAALARLRSAMELVAPRVALSAEVPFDALASATDEQRDAWHGAVHRLHLHVDAAVERKAWLPWFERFAGPASTSSLLVECGDADGRVDAATDRALDLARLAADHAGNRVALALDPTLGFSPLSSNRLLVTRLAEAGLDLPIALVDRPAARRAHGLLGPATALGGLLCDGVGDSVQVVVDDPTECRAIGFGILQAARVRITKTEFISCPSCGRTLFDLEETTARIKRRTAHLKGVKIAVMGCIVNGPGEMADADFGYVGWGEDKIALFVGKDMVEKDIPTSRADERLVELIKHHGMWVDPPVAV